MIFSLLIIHNHDRMSTITPVLRPTTWDHFTLRLPDHFSRCPMSNSSEGGDYDRL